MKFLDVIGTLGVFGTVAYGATVTGNNMSPAGNRNMQAKLAHWEYTKNNNVARKSVRKQETLCINGNATIDGEDFPCDNIDFYSFLSLADAAIQNPNGGQTVTGSDIWGWLSPEGKEITLWCVDNGIWFVDTTDPTDPLQLGYMPTERPQALWADVKVFNNTAYVVKDGPSSPPTYGVQVFDLLRLVDLEEDATREFEPDFVYHGHANSHNLVSDTESGFLYSVGTNTCLGGLHILDLNQNRLEPTEAACYGDDQYTHDAQCVVYRGPDTRFTGRQICLAFNEDTLSIIDTTDKNDIQLIGRRGYSTFKYTHQGWFTQDFKYVLLNDELDEVESPAIERTTTFIFDVQNLSNPIFVSDFTHPEVSIDHNLYMWGPTHKYGWAGNPPMENPPNGNYVYLSNYVAGVKVLDITDITNPVTIGKFDIAPDINEVNEFSGIWSNYMHPSGALAVSTFERGLFMLRPNMAFDEERNVTTAPGVVPTSFPTDVLFEPPAVPDEWSCRSRYYSDNEFCDCGCGVLDPDCTNGLPRRGCSCSEDFLECFVPDDWICNPQYYDVADGCDCECGTPDPDCELEGQTLYGCAGGECIEGVCYIDGETRAPVGSPTEVPVNTTEAPVASPVDVTASPVEVPVASPVDVTASPVEVPVASPVDVTASPVEVPVASPVDVTDSPVEDGSGGDGEVTPVTLIVMLVIVILLMFVVIYLLKKTTASKEKVFEVDVKEEKASI